MALPGFRPPQTSCPSRLVFSGSQPRIARILLPVSGMKGATNQGDNADTFQQVVDDGGEALLLFRILGQCPWRCLIDVLVAGGDQFPDTHQCLVEGHLVDLAVDLLDVGFEKSDEVIVNLGCCGPELARCRRNTCRGMAVERLTRLPRSLARSELMR